MLGIRRFRRPARYRRTRARGRPPGSVARRSPVRARPFGMRRAIASNAQRQFTFVRVRLVAGLGDVHLVPGPAVAAFPGRAARRCHTARPAGIWRAGGPARPPARSPSPRPRRPAGRTAGSRSGAAPGPRAGPAASPAHPGRGPAAAGDSRPGRTARPGPRAWPCRPAAGSHRSAARRPPARTHRSPARASPAPRRPPAPPGPSPRASSSRFTSRIRPRTWVESVRCRIPAQTRPSSPSRASSASSSAAAAGTDGPMNVVVPGLSSQHNAETALARDQHAVRALGPSGPDPALCVTVPPALRTSLHDPYTLSGEDLIERGREPGVAVRMRNRNWLIRLASVTTRLRPAGWSRRRPGARLPRGCAPAVTPRMHTRRVAISITNSTYNRLRKIVSTVKKSHASSPPLERAGIA